MNTRAFPQAHFATFPEEIPRRCILAGTSEGGCCPQCGASYRRIVEKTVLPPPDRQNNNPFKHDAMTNHGEDGSTLRNQFENRTLGFAETCTCEAGPAVPCTVLDPFVGTGTTCLVAKSLNRRSIGIDLSESYLAMRLPELRQEMLL